MSASRTEVALTRGVVAVVVLTFAARKYSALARGWVGDRTHARAQRRGDRLARTMHADGTLAARSPRKAVTFP